MQKKGFTIVEVVLVFLLILAVTFLILPKSLDTTRQAKFISKWIQKYSSLQYMYTVIKAQREDVIKEKINGAHDNDGRKLVLLEEIKPYLRITSEVKGNYKQFYMDKTPVASGSTYYFNNFYMTNTGEIIGLKWLDGGCKSGCVCAALSVDVNGLEKPNTWGYDVFGVNISNDSVDAIGKGVDPDLLKKGCSRDSYGVYCSYYYLIGGRFD